jgi:hypothetical protein
MTVSAAQANSENEINPTIAILEELIQVKRTACRPAEQLMKRALNPVRLE